jgi:hypothetical protein
MFRLRSQKHLQTFWQKKPAPPPLDISQSQRELAGGRSMNKIGWWSKNFIVNRFW